MPITLTKLFSPKAVVSFPFLGETIHVTWAPFRYTGEMQDLADRMLSESESDQADISALRKQIADVTAEAEELEASEEPDVARIAALRAEALAAESAIGSREIKLDHRDKKGLREVLATLLVAWDVLGPDGKPIATDVATLSTLPDTFLQAVFVSLYQENQADPQNAPTSDEPSNTVKGSARSLNGTNTSEAPARSGSRRSSSTNARTAPATIPSGAPGH